MGEQSLDSNPGGRVSCIDILKGHLWDLLFLKPPVILCQMVIPRLAHNTEQCRSSQAVCTNGHFAEEIALKGKASWHVFLMAANLKGNCLFRLSS